MMRTMCKNKEKYSDRQCRRNGDDVHQVDVDLLFCTGGGVQDNALLGSGTDAGRPRWSRCGRPGAQRCADKLALLSSALGKHAAAALTFPARYFIPFTIWFASAGVNCTFALLCRHGNTQLGNLLTMFYESKLGFITFKRSVFCYLADHNRFRSRRITSAATYLRRPWHAQCMRWRWQGNGFGRPADVLLLAYAIDCIGDIRGIRFLYCREINLDNDTHYVSKWL